MNTRGWAMLALVVVLVGAIVLYWTKSHPEESAKISVPALIQARFSCDGGKSIETVFDNDKQQVQLSLSDGRMLTIPRALSADGARYATVDERFVFWNKGDTAFITEAGVETYSGCTTVQ